MKLIRPVQVQISAEPDAEKRTQKKKRGKKDAEKRRRHEKRTEGNGK